MNPSYPPDVASFVQHLLASGVYSSEDDVMIDALRVLRETKLRHDALRQDIQAAIAELDQGKGVPWDVEEFERALLHREGPSHGNN